MPPLRCPSWEALEKASTLREARVLISRPLVLPYNCDARPPHHVLKAHKLRLCHNSHLPRTGGRGHLGHKALPGQQGLNTQPLQGPRQGPGSVLCPRCPKKGPSRFFCWSNACSPFQTLPPWAAVPHPSPVRYEGPSCGNPRGCAVTFVSSNQAGTP